ncbi:MAG: hypothetical protein HXY44_13030 [Syntrophaceae bacterium]|nr:hypothetical protein [Syntrophaceae bacterium]
MNIEEGERFKHKFTGLCYEVKTVKEGTCILESVDSPYRMWFRERDIELFFETAEKRKAKLSSTVAFDSNSSKKI